MMRLISTSTKSKSTLLLLSTLLSVGAYAATGDVIFECDFDTAFSASLCVGVDDPVDCCTGEGTGPTCTDTVENRWGACGGQEDIPNEAGLSIISTDWGQGIRQYEEHYSPMTTAQASGETAITIEFKERYNLWPADDLDSDGGANVKGWRGEVSSYLFPGTIHAHFSRGFYIYYGDVGGDDVETGDVYIDTDRITEIKLDSESDGYCWHQSGNYYTCQGRVKVWWTPDGGTTSGCGTTWHTWRYYIDIPTTDESEDGEVIIWIDNLWFMTITNARRDPLVNQDTFDDIKFHESSECGASSECDGLGLDIDEITIWEGYVPPEGGGIVGGSLTGGSIQ